MSGKKEPKGSDAKVQNAFERILSHVENNGDVYPGAISDQILIRATMADGGLSDALEGIEARVVEDSGSGSVES